MNFVEDFYSNQQPLQLQWPERNGENDEQNVEDDADIIENILLLSQLKRDSRRETSSSTQITSENPCSTSTDSERLTKNSKRLAVEEVPDTADSLQVTEKCSEHISGSSHDELPLSLPENTRNSLDKQESLTSSVSSSIESSSTTMILISDDTTSKCCHQSSSKASDMLNPIENNSLGFLLNYYSRMEKTSPITVDIYDWFLNK